MVQGVRPLVLGGPCLFAALLSVSCGNFSGNISANGRHDSERRAQANDALTGGASLVGTAFRATAVAAVRQPFTTVKVGIANLWNRPREIVSGNLPLDLTDTRPPLGPPGSQAFEAQLDAEHFPKAESGRVKWLIDGNQFFPELDRQIAAAKKAIHVQVFIFDNDDIAVRYADVLKQRSQDVSVHVLFDDLGTTSSHNEAPATPGPSGFTPPSEMRMYLRNDSKVKARRILDPWLVCDHTKLLVFDNQSAILGGMNIGREYYSEWHDFMVRVEGPVVGTLSREFNRAWNKAGPWGDFAMLKRDKKLKGPGPIADSIPIRVLRTDPAEGRYEILKAIRLAIRGAQKRVWIETPYFAHDDIVAACVDAARRGVDVRVVVPGDNDSNIMDQGNLSTARAFIQAGGRVYQYPKMNHTKIMICDDWVCAGSANLDTLSMRINRELNIAFADGKALREVEQQVFQRDFAVSRKLKLSDTNAPGAGLAETIADQL